MARINRAMLTKAEIIQVATKLFLQNGYSTTTTKAVCDELQMSKGNLTFHYPTKDHLLAVLVEMLCSFQWEMMEQEANEGYSSIMAICLELMAMASMCEIDEVAKDLYISAYTSTMSLEIIRRNDARRAKMVFAEYCRGWSDEQFAEAETLVSGIEYATLMTTADSASLDVRIAGALDLILTIYNVPENIRRMKVRKVLATDYRGIGQRILSEFREYVEKTSHAALEELILGTKKQ